MVEDARALAMTGLVEVAKVRRRYFVVMASLLLATVVIGFSRTFFARALFELPSIPWYAYLHGSLLTSWFVLLVAQTSLVAAHRTDLHRRLGALGVFVAAGVVAISLALVLGFPARAKAGIFFGERAIDPTTVSIIVWSDIAALAVFVLYVAFALYLRHRSDVHKRLLLLASIAILGPASARLVLLLAEHTSVPSWAQASIQGVLFLGLPLTLFFYDWRAIRRVHPATIAGVVGIVVSTLVGIAIASSPAGASLIAALE